MTTKQKRRARMNAELLRIKCTVKHNVYAKYNRYRHIMFHMPYGKDRREQILNVVLIDFDDIEINRSHRPNLKYDLDLQYLIKKGVLVQKRGMVLSSRCSYSCLVLAK